MTTYRLSRDVTVQFRGYPVTAKAGTKLEHVPHNAGLKVNRCAIPPASCDPGPCAALFAFDGKHYYVWAPEDAVETVEG